MNFKSSSKKAFLEMKRKLYKKEGGGRRGGKLRKEGNLVYFR